MGELIKAHGSQAPKKQPAENNAKKAVHTAAKNIKNETIVEKDNEDSDNNQLVREVKPELAKRDQIRQAEPETQNKRNQEKKAPPAKEAKESKGHTKTQPVAEKQDQKTTIVSVKPVEVKEVREVKEETKQRVAPTPKQVA